MKKIIICVLLVLLASASHAANKYVRAGATGSGSGDDWTNAYASIPSTLTRGNTYYFADGSYGYYAFDDAVSGTSKIIFKKATTTDHGTETGWSSSYGDGQAIFSNGIEVYTGYFEIDGSKRNENNWQDGSAYGFRINLNTGNGCAIRVPYKSGTRYEVINLTIKYCYMPGWGPDDAGTPAQRTITSWAGHTSVGWYIGYNYLYNSGDTFFWASDGTHNATFEYNYMDTNEDSQVPPQHGNGFYCLRSCRNWHIRYNVFDKIEGTNVIAAGAADYTVTGIKVYGNVFKDSPWMGNGVFSGWSSYPLADSYFYNNTIVNIPRCYSGYTNDRTITSYNNIYIGCTEYKFQGSHDYNAFSNSGLSEAHGQYNLSTSIFANYASRDLRLAAPTNAGTTLASPYNYDVLGRLRGADNSWDRGAYEYNSGSAPGDTTPPVITVTGPPASFSCTTDPMTVQITATTDESANMRFATSAEYAGGKDTYAEMTSTFAVTGGTTHSQSHSRACDASYSVWIAAADAAGNASTPTEVAYTIGAATPTPEVFISGTRFGENSSCTVNNVTTYDNYISSENPTLKFEFTSDMYLRTTPADTAGRTILIKMDLSGIPTNAVVSEAKFYLYSFVAGGDATIDTTVHQVTGDAWTNLATWNTYDGTNSWGATLGALGDIAAAEATVAVSDTAGWVGWTVTSMVSDWIATPANNKGLAITTDQGASHATLDTYRGFYSSNYADAALRPILIIQYTIPPPANKTISGSGTLTLTPGGGTLTFSW